MAKYIDADEFMVKIANIAKAFAKSEKQQALIGRVMYCLEKQPAADVREDVHGEWLFDHDLKSSYCSVCHHLGMKKYRFCLHCGADMRKERLTNG